MVEKKKILGKYDFGLGTIDSFLMLIHTKINYRIFERTINERYLLHKNTTDLSFTKSVNMLRGMSSNLSISKW